MTGIIDIVVSTNPQTSTVQNPKGNILDYIFQNVISVDSGTSMVCLTNNSNTSLSKATLNGTYPTAMCGQLVLLPNANLKYEKLDNLSNGNWDEQPYRPAQ